jgi:hypothetical protein
MDEKAKDDRTISLEDVTTRDSTDEVENVAPSSSNPPLAGKDKAAQFLRQTGRRIEVTPEDNARILRKIDLTILPILLVVYCLQSLDKTSLSYASVFGLIDDAHLHGQQYSWLGSIVYLAQLVMQPLVAYFLVKLPTGKFTATRVLCWGITLTGMTAATSFGGLFATRLLLGAFEASVAPAFIAIVQMWYRRSEQTNRNAAWYSMLGVVNMLGSLLSYGLGHINSPHLHSYQIIFLFCGLLTVAFSAVIFIFMPDSPIEAKFLKGDDKLIAIERLRMNQMGVASRIWKWDHVREAFKDPKTFFWFALLFAISIPSGGISTFGPLIVKSFGFNSFTTILFNIPFGAVQMISTLGGAYLATRWKKKAPILILLCIPPIVGCVILLAVGREKQHRAELLVGYYLISVYPGISPLIYSWSGQNTGGDTKRKVTTGILFVGASAGNVIGPHLYTTAEAPRYTRGLLSNLILFIIIIITVILATLWLVFLNKKHARQRAELGKAAQVNDPSMEDNARLRERADSINQHEGVGDKGFDDETDLRNEDFIYVY